MIATVSKPVSFVRQRGPGGNQPPWMPPEKPPNPKRKIPRLYYGTPAAVLPGAFVEPLPLSANTQAFGYEGLVLAAAFTFYILASFIIGSASLRRG